jgi:hypothetical protein
LPPLIDSVDKIGFETVQRLGTDDMPSPGVSLYVIAKGGVASVNKSAGDDPGMAFLAALGATSAAGCKRTSTSIRRATFGR